MPPSRRHLVRSAPDNAASAVRKDTAPCVIGGKTINTGDIVLGPFRQFHLNAGIFCEDAHAFNPRRFFQNRNLQRTKGYAPFGGGHTYCLSRLFAQREIYLFVAMTLYRFDMCLGSKEGGPKVPAVDTNRPSAAAMVIYWWHWSLEYIKDRVWEIWSVSSQVTIQPRQFANEKCPFKGRNLGLQLSGTYLILQCYTSHYQTAVIFWKILDWYYQ